MFSQVCFHYPSNWVLYFSFRSNSSNESKCVFIPPPTICADDKMVSCQNFSLPDNNQPWNLQGNYNRPTFIHFIIVNLKKKKFWRNIISECWWKVSCKANFWFSWTRNPRETLQIHIQEIHIVFYIIEKVSIDKVFSYSSSSILSYVKVQSWSQYFETFWCLNKFPFHKKWKKRDY